jgi:hypothetical protein
VYLAIQLTDYDDTNGARCGVDPIGLKTGLFRGGPFHFAQEGRQEVKSARFWSVPIMPFSRRVQGIVSFDPTTRTGLFYHSQPQETTQVTDGAAFLRLK